MTPWLWAYWPVMKVARAGQQSGNESTASAKVVPLLAEQPPDLRHEREVGGRHVVGHDDEDVRAVVLAGADRARVGGAAREPRAAPTRPTPRSAAAQRIARDARSRTSALSFLGSHWPPCLHHVSHCVNNRLCSRYNNAKPPGRARHSREETRERIVAAATELVRERSYQELSVGEIMERAGFERTIFYRHFDDLGDLLLRAGREAIEGLYEAELDLGAARDGLASRTPCAPRWSPRSCSTSRHGPLLRALAEAGRRGRRADRRRAGGDAPPLRRARRPTRCSDFPEFADARRTDLLETARALNLMNIAYLLDAFGREPRISTETRGRDGDRDLDRRDPGRRRSRRAEHAGRTRPRRSSRRSSRSPAAPSDGPLVMLNLNRYRDRDAYVRYGEVATGVLERVGGQDPLARAGAGDVIGEEGDGYDDVIAVWYPSAAAFVELATDPEILEARADRVEGLERAALIRCEPGEAEDQLSARSRQ